MNAKDCALRGFKARTIGGRNAVLLAQACWILISSAALKQQLRGQRRDQLQHEAAVTAHLSRHFRDKEITLLGVSQKAAVDDFGANLRLEERWKIWISPSFWTFSQ